TPGASEFTRTASSSAGCVIVAKMTKISLDAEASIESRKPACRTRMISRHQTDGDGDAIARRAAHEGEFLVLRLGRELERRHVVGRRMLALEDQHAIGEIAAI